MSAGVDALPDMLTRLKLTAMRDRLDGLLDEAARDDLSLRETLALLCGAEVAHREERRIQMGTAIAKFPHGRTLEGFDFAAQPSLDPKQVRDLASCRWVANGDALLIQGPPGVGKSHLAIALGREAIRHGYSVLFTSATALVTTLVKGHSEGRLEHRSPERSRAVEQPCQHRRQAGIARRHGAEPLDRGGEARWEKLMGVRIEMPRDHEADQHADAGREAIEVARVRQKPEVDVGDTEGVGRAQAQPAHRMGLVHRK